MNHLLIVVLPDLTGGQQALIREAASRHGYECRFFREAAEAMTSLSEAEIIVSSDPVLSMNAPNLRWLCTPFAGADRFCAPGAFASPSALLSNSSGAYGVTISEHVIMVLLETLRRQPEYQAHIQRREWVRRLPVRSIHGSRIALLGVGDIGQETLRRLRAFSPARVTGISRSGRNPDGLLDRAVPGGELDAVLPETDILIVSLPGTAETFHMIGKKQLRLLPDHAVIVNVGRGSILDQEALEAELRGGRLFAALDVFEEEPVPEASTLWTCPRLILTPHVAGDTTLPHTMERIVEMFLEDFENYCQGRPLLRLVDRKLGY